MEVYFAGSEAFPDIILGDEPGNPLMSYYYVASKFGKFEEYLKKFPANKKLFIDSGAFTAWTKGKKIDVDEYIKFLNQYSDYIYLFGQLDVIPGDIVSGHTEEQVEEAAAATWENYLYMRSRVKKPDSLLYTFHVGEPVKYLKQALEWLDSKGKHIPYIALGGMVGKPMPVKEQFLDTCFRIIQKSSNPTVKVHAFGMTSFYLFEKYPIESGDSTSWIRTGAVGGIATDAGIIEISEQRKTNPQHYSHLSNADREAFEANLLKYGFTFDELSQDYKSRLRYHVRYYTEKAANTHYVPGPKRISLF